MALRPRPLARRGSPGAETSRKAVAPPLAGWRTHASQSRPSSPSARSALRPTATSARGRRRSISSPSTSAPARSSPTAGVRFESGSPGRCGCAGTTFQSTVSASIPSVASAPWTIVPDCSAQPSGRTLVAAYGGPQPCSVRSAVNAMPGEATARVAHRLADEQQRLAAGARVQVGSGVGAAERRGIDALERRIGLAEHGEGRAERALGDALDEAARSPQAGAPALSTACTCAAMRSRTACSSPARRSSIGSGCACTMASKKTLRSW